MSRLLSSPTSSTRPSPPFRMGALVLALLSAVAVLSPGLSQAQSPIALHADRTRIPLGGVTQVRVTIEGRKLDKAPRFPRSEGLEISMAGRSSSFSMVNGEVSQETIYSFQVAGLELGEHQLGPAEALIDGKRAVSKTVMIEVVDPGKARARRSLVPGSQNPGADENRGDFYANAAVSDKQPYVGESLAYILEVGTAVAVRGTSWDRPNWGTLSAEPGIEPAQHERPEVQGGRRYNVSSVVVPLFAVEPGPTTIAPSELEVGVVQRGISFLQPTVGKGFSSESVSLNVRPLPTTGRPGSFGGAVGRFELSASVDRTRIDAGETVTLSLRLTGKGALRSPKVKIALPDEFRVYSEAPDRKVSLAGSTLRTTVTFREALVPTEPGTWKIPPVHFPYFNPETGTYETTSSKPITLEVGGHSVVDTAVLARSAELATKKESIEVLGSDLLPLHAGERMLGDARLRLTSPLVLALLLLPLLGFSSVATVVARRRLSGTSRGQRQARSRAARTAEKAARKAAREGDIEGVEQAARDFLTARLQCSGAALSPDEGRNAVVSGGGSESLAAELARLLEDCEATRFGGAPAGSLAEDLAAWVDRANREWA